MKIFVLNPPFLPKFSRESRSPAVAKSGTLYYPMWLAYAVGYLEKHGHEVLFVDAPATGLSADDICRKAAEFKPDMAVLEASTPSIYNDVEVAANVNLPAETPNITSLPAGSKVISVAASRTIPPAVVSISNPTAEVNLLAEAASVKSKSKTSESFASPI